MYPFSAGRATHCINALKCNDTALPIYFQITARFYPVHKLIISCSQVFLFNINTARRSFSTIRRK